MHQVKPEPPQAPRYQPNGPSDPFRKEEFRESARPEQVS